MVGSRVAMILFGLLCIAWMNAGGIDTPQVHDERIVFVGGKVLRYVRTRRLAPTPTPPEFADRVIAIRESPIVVSTWQRVVLVREEILSEGAAIEISVYDYRGNELGTSGVASSTGWFEDSVFLLEKARRIFLGQTSAHQSIGAGYLLDENGHLVRRVDQPPDTVEFGHSEDERIVWMVAPRGVDDPEETISDVLVIDSLDGRRIATRERRPGETVTIEYRGTKYEIVLKASRS